MPDEPEALGLLALMLLTDSRRQARTTRDGAPGALADQDRGRWDGADRRGPGTGAVVPAAGQPGPYQLQAAINAVTATRGPRQQTDWGQIVQLYDQLMAMAPPLWSR